MTTYEQTFGDLTLVWSEVEDPKTVGSKVPQCRVAMVRNDKIVRTILFPLTEEGLEAAAEEHAPQALELLARHEHRMASESEGT